MKPIRVVHIASDDAWGGAERVLSILAPALARRPEIDVEVILLNEGHLSSVLRGEGMRVRVVNEQELRPIPLIKALRQAITGADLVHAHRYKEIALASLICTRRQHLVVTIHGLEPWRDMSCRHAAKVWAALWLARLRGSRFIAVSGELKHRLHRALVTLGIEQIPNPFVPSPKGLEAINLRAHFRWRPDRRLVGFVGRLEPVKGPDLLLQAVELMDKEIGAVFIGAGSLGDALRAHCDERNLGSRVGFLGEVPDARPYLKQLDVLALPSRHEGLPMIVLEAADAGLPVAAFNVGGVEEVLSNRGGTRLVRRGDIRGLAFALTSLLQDQSAGTHAQEWGRRLSRRFSLETVVARHTTAYLAAMASSRVRGNDSPALP